MAPRSTSRLLALPVELRQRILASALRHEGTVELQYPLWTGKGQYQHGICQVSRSLRSEALEVFYKTNSFLWIVDVAHSTRSDPALYPVGGTCCGDGAGGGGDGDEQLFPHPLPATVPWLYPELFRHLRRLHVNVYLPSDGDEEAWRCGFPRQLGALVRVLEGGRRLKYLSVLLTSKVYDSRIALSTERLKELETLAEMKVRGEVRVRIRYDFRQVRREIEALGLESRMKA